MIEGLTIKQQEQFLYFRRLCKLFCKFTELWSDVNVICEDKTVYVFWYNKLMMRDDKGNKIPYMNHTTREFPISDLKRKIKHKKEEIREEFNERHNNKRLIKEKKLRQLQLLNLDNNG